MKNLILLLISFTFIHCSKSDGIAEQKVSADLVVSDKLVNFSESEPAPPPPQEEPQQRTTKRIDTISKKIIKNGDMRIQVGDIKKSQGQVNEILKKNNAYIQTEDFRNSDADENLNLTIRVPHKNFDALINSFSDGIGSVLSKNISSEDVTEEYTDVAIKLANKKIYLEKYRDLLKRASNTKDMLEIQEKIRGLEDEIDVAEGKLRFIDDRVNYSTLNLSLYKEKVRSSATSKIGFGSRFGDSLTQGWNSFISFILGVISLWPFFLAIPVLIFLWRKWKGRRKK
ncbi:DUF4349 domain-containing protein [Chryseobacterium paridis]|uniref:DUF4349 domain-containing protein n=1 Tax=Chryseobacterium paridis TaxID=2800328 RepID=A0ABS1FTZ6_9FLAO|nr:DUF4349 domain-containing protein [Chryseobacterium paridis]MBK1895898.1 DUF4349 domain-containing protein [Chryseobacterium paridis]